MSKYLFHAIQEKLMPNKQFEPVTDLIVVWNEDIIANDASGTIEKIQEKHPDLSSGFLSNELGT